MGWGGQNNLKKKSLQIGNRFALTAAHCLYDDDNEELLPASSFSIMLGLHDRRKAKEPNRCAIAISAFEMNCFVKGDRLGSARFLSTKTSLTM